MVHGDLRACFRRFRDEGDVVAFEAIFDATAGDLLELARRLLRSAPGAESPEDLVQETFLVAIEARETFDATRPLEPWLAGILAHRAAAARRRSRRIENAPAVEPQTLPGSPSAAAETHELEREVARSLESLPERYRDIVAARIDGTRTPAEIARASGVVPGVVRMRLHRGLAILRRALPGGLTASLLLVLDARVALAATRRVVVAHAASIHGAAATTAATVTGALVVSKHLVLVSTVLAVLVGVVALFLQLESGPANDRAVVVAPADVAPPPADASRPDTEIARNAAEVAREGPSAAETPPASVPPESYLRALAGVRGRLLESDASPVAHCELVVLEFDDSRFTADLATLTAGGLELPASERTRTDAEGRFRIARLTPFALHALAVDFDGPRATLRVLDAPLSSGVETDLGDIVLGPTTTLSGRVVDEEGEPIASARVRVAPLAMPFLGSGVERVRADSIVRIDRGGAATHEPLPDWMRGVVARLPLPTTRTAADGRFHVDGAPAGSMTVVIDAPGFVCSSFGPNPMGASRARDLGDLPLPAGRVVAGRVLDAKRQPFAGAELIAGVRPVLPIGAAFLTERATTDATGRFEIRGISEDSEALLAVRPARGSSWRAVAVESGELEIVLDDVTDHELIVTSEDGRKIGAITVRLAPQPESGPAGILERALEWGQPLVVTANSPGSFVVRGLRIGSYDALVEAPGCGVVAVDLDVGPRAEPTTVTFPRSSPLTIHVQDAATGAPVDYAAVDVFSPRDAAVAIHSLRTDARGVVRIAESAFAPTARLDLRVRHPAYCALRTATVLEDGVAVARLTHGGAIEGSIRCEGSPAASPYVVLLRPALSTGIVLAPTFVAANAASEFRVSGLRPITYSYEVFPNFLASDFRTAAARVSTDFSILQRAPEARGEVVVTAGETSRLDIDVFPANSTANGVVRGRVTSKGVPLAGAKVFVQGSRDQRYREVDADGRYEVSDVPPGDVEVQCYVSVEEPIAIRTSEWKKVKLERGGVATCDFAIGELELVVRVLDAGAPVQDAIVKLRTAGDSDEWVGHMRTDAQGIARLVAQARGAHRVIVHCAAGYAVESMNLEIGTTERTLELESGVTLAGELEREEGRPDRLLLRMYATVNGAELVDVCPIDAAAPSFRFEHVPPGRVVLELETAPNDLRRLEIDATSDRTDWKLAFPAK